MDRPLDDVISERQVSRSEADSGLIRVVHRLIHDHSSAEESEGELEAGAPVGTTSPMTISERYCRFTLHTRCLQGTLMISQADRTYS